MTIQEKIKEISEMFNLNRMFYKGKSAEKNILEVLNCSWCGKEIKEDIVCLKCFDWAMVGGD